MVSSTDITNYLNQAATSNTTNSSSASSSSTTSSSSSSSAALGENDFMTLLIAQLKNQNPSNPQDSSAFVAELAQFSSLQQETQVNQNLQQFAANSMIGYKVTDNTGNTGVVTGVSNGGPNSSTGLQLDITTSSGTTSTIDYSNITNVTLSNSQGTSS
ncbi:MAG: flagellar hook capping FlgD N-terminal domain-containing protein [Dissulfurispiraceae bacterium]